MFCERLRTTLACSDDAIGCVFCRSQYLPKAQKNNTPVIVYLPLGLFVCVDFWHLEEKSRARSLVDTKLENDRRTEGT